jgi:hypothetical protein
MTEKGDVLSLAACMKIADAGLAEWKSKPHNAQWWRRIDGTPIPSGLTFHIAEAFAAAIRAELRKEKG